MRHSIHSLIFDRQRKQGRLSLRRRGFTFVEVLIVVLAIGILAMVVFPQFHSEKEQTRELQLKDQLHYLRTQIMVFRAQHQDIPPGYPDGFTMAAPSAEAAVAQLTERSNLTLNTSFENSSDFPYGPYLKQIPMNPINGLNSIQIVHNNQAMPAPDGTTGWIYKPQTQEIIANVKGATKRGRRTARIEVGSDLPKTALRFASRLNGEGWRGFPFRGASENALLDKIA